MNAEVASLLDKARRGLIAARRDLDRGDLDFAASRAYYAMFHAAVAMLRLRQMAFSRHSAVIAAFGREFVVKGPIAKEHHAALIEAFEVRQLADYSPGMGVGEPKARRLLQQAEAFVRAVETHARALPG